MSGNNSTPWKTPKPLESAFCSTGALPKKHVFGPERLSMPLLTTPGTPSKRERSKFVAATGLKPFALSPRELKRRSLEKQVKSINSKLSSCVGNFMDDDDHSAGESTEAEFSPTMRSFSPCSNFPSSVGQGMAPVENSEGQNNFVFQKDEDDMNPFEGDDYTLPLAKDFFFAGSGSTAGLISWKSDVVNLLSLDYLLGPHVSSVQSFPLLNGHSADYMALNHRLLELVGHGSFSEVFKAQRLNDAAIVAMKRSLKPFTGTCDRQRRLQEVVNMWLVAGHNHCVQILEAWEQYGYLFIVTELCENGTLHDVIEYMAQANARFTEYQIWQILYQIASGLDHIHRQGIVHLDLKPANIFIDQVGVLKIGDFGLSIAAGSEHDIDMEGDKYYMAPETLDGVYEKPADIFSLGLIMLELAADVDLPSQGLSWQNLRHGDFSELSFDEVSDALHNLIKEMTDPDPQKRPSTSHVLAISDLQATRLKER